MEYKHPCIKCGTTYESNDPDAYYCPTCEVEKKAIAKEVDAKLAGKVSKREKSGWQEYNEIRRKTGMNFPRIGDLGITL